MAASSELQGISATEPPPPPVEDQVNNENDIKQSKGLTMDTFSVYINIEQENTETGDTSSAGMGEVTLAAFHDEYTAEVLVDRIIENVNDITIGNVHENPKLKPDQVEDETAKIVAHLERISRRRCFRVADKAELKDTIDELKQALGLC